MSELPKISIVTPSFNQAAFLEETIKSVLGQQYANLEYVVMDGGSTDGSVEIIRKHADKLAYWQSEKDGGQYDAINRGFGKTSGEIMAWINSDDKYLPGALSVVSEIFMQNPQVEWITTRYPVVWDKHGRAVWCGEMPPYSKRGFSRGENLPWSGWYATNYIEQESTFWRRSLWERAGGCLDMSYKLAEDYELWARFYQHAELYGVSAPLAGFRMHGDQRSVIHAKIYHDECLRAMRQHGGQPATRFSSWLRKRGRLFLPGKIQAVLGLVWEGQSISFIDGSWKSKSEVVW